MPVRAYYYVTECGASPQCSVQSWRKAKCNGATSMEAMERLKHHYMFSSFHGFSKQKAEELVARADVEKWETEEPSDDDAVVVPSPAKKMKIQEATDPMKFAKEAFADAKYAALRFREVEAKATETAACANIAAEKYEAAMASLVHVIEYGAPSS